MGAPCAPTIDPRLRELIERADRRTSAAELTRRVGDEANAIGLVRPSYQQVRVLLAARAAERRPSRSVSTLAVAMDVAFRLRPAWDLPNYLYGDPLPYRPGARNEPRRRS